MSALCCLFVLAGGRQIIILRAREHTLLRPVFFSPSCTHINDNINKLNKPKQTTHNNTKHKHTNTTQKKVRRAAAEGHRGAQRRRRPQPAAQRRDAAAQVLQPPVPLPGRRAGPAVPAGCVVAVVVCVLFVCCVVVCCLNVGLVVVCTRVCVRVVGRVGRGVGRFFAVGGLLPRPLRRP